MLQRSLTPWPIVAVVASLLSLLSLVLLVAIRNWWLVFGVLIHVVVIGVAVLQPDWAERLHG